MKLVKKILSVTMITTLSLFLSASAFAAQSETNNIGDVLVNREGLEIENVSENTVNIQSKTEEGTVTITENENERLVTMIDSFTGETNYIKYDKIENTVYSSLIGETIDLTENTEYQPKDEVSLARAVTSYETKYISYAQIKKVVGKTASVTSVIGAILFFVPGAQFIGGASSSIGTVVSELSKGISASNKHGIKLKIKVTKYYRGTTKNKHVYKKIRSIVGGSIY